MVSTAKSHAMAEKSQVTLSSIELSELSGRRHSDIIRSIRRMNKDLMNMGRTPVALVEYTDKKWETRPMANLTKYQCELLAMALSGEARIRVLDRLYELEEHSNHTLPTSSRLMSQGVAIPNVALKADDLGQFALAVWQGIKQIQERMEAAEEEYQEKINTVTNLLKEQHDIIGELTEENMKLNSQEPTERIMQALQELTGQKLLVAPPDAITIKGFLASIKVKLSPGNVLRFSHIARQMCAELWHKIAKIPDERYGFLNLYPQFILKSAFEQMELS